jgi:uncharacterized alkaline shock family protein YloU
VRSKQSVEAAPALSSPLGRITIASDVIAQIVSHVTAEAYGVVGMSARGLGRLLPGDRSRRAIDISRDDDGVRIDLHVVVEYGLNLAEVASTLRNRVAYEVERLTGLRVSAIEVHIEDVRTSA